MIDVNTLKYISEAALTAVKLYRDLDKYPEYKKYLEEVTDESWTEYDKMVLLYMKHEADKMGVEVENLSDEFCNRIDDHIEEFRVLLKQFSQIIPR